VFPQAAFTVSARGCFENVLTKHPRYSRKPRPRRLRCSRFGISCLRDAIPPNSVGALDGRM
jgi:hypothetical protein